VVVNWNGGAENLACLASLLAQGLEQTDVVFVDNGSRDGSLESVRRAYPGLQVISNGSNLGYGAATNQGIALLLEQRVDLVWLVNNDVELPPATLQLLLAAFAASEALGIAAPRIVYKHDPATIWCAGGRLTFRQNLTTLIGHGRPDGAEFRRTFAVDYAVGAAMLVRRQVFERAGLLDAAYFAYHEDVEFCVRAREAGFEVATVGEALALHAAHVSTGGGYNPRRKYMMAVNTVWFLRAHGSLRRWLSFAVYDVLTLPALVVVSAFRGRARAALAKALGTLHGLMGRRVRAELLEPGRGPLW
jgi:GT2 family glycosyltransferase